MSRCFHGYLNAGEFFSFTMPPKKEKSSKKGPKLSKAQKLKQLQEEEERRLQEEEEARLQAEKEEEERQERERREKELERLELKDRERRDDELNELCHLLEENRVALTKWKTDALEKAKWERYLLCDGTPDPSVHQEINTYISLWRDDPEVNIGPVLEQCNLALKLFEELEGLLREAADQQEAQKYQEALINLQELIHFKHQLATEEILKTASANIDTETGNMQTVVKDDNITLCLWANFKKNPRFKGLTFKEASMSFMLPKQLAVSEIAVRILHTRYDHLSLLARIAHQRRQSSSHSARSLAGGDEIAEDVDLLLEQVETISEEEVKKDSETQDDRQYEEVQSIHESDGRKSPDSEHSRGYSSKLAEGQVSQPKTQIEALNEGDLTSPSAQVTNIDQDEIQVVDLMQYTPLGGVFYYDVFHLPPQAHQVNSWEIRQVFDNGLQVFPYPTESNLEDNSCPPVGVSVKLPDSVLFLETPQVAQWDVAGKQWRMDGITDMSYDEKEAEISFKMSSFQAFVVMQKTYANFPFQSWELRPLGQDYVVYNINGALIDLSITIQGDQCMLHSKEEKGLSHFTGKWMSSLALQQAMINAGINIFVNEYTEQYVDSCGKDPLTEHAAYEQMALFASACAFSWSQWNAKCGAEYLVLQACEHLSPDAVPEDSWILYLLGAQRSQKLDITEKSEEFSTDLYPGSEFHATFIHMLQDIMSPDGTAMTRKSNYLFVDTVQYLLCATRPLMCS